MTIPIIKPYVNSQQHMFEKQMKSIENKGIKEGSLDKLIERKLFTLSEASKDKEHVEFSLVIFIS